MATNLDVLNALGIGQVAHLKSVSGGHDEWKSAGAQFFEDGLEEWHMGSVVQVNPDLWFRASMACELTTRWRRGAASYHARLAHEVGYLARQRMPIRSPISGARVFQKPSIHFDRILAGTL